MNSLYFFIVITLITCFSCSRKVIHHTEFVNNEKLIQLKNNYAVLLESSPDSIKNYNLFRSIDNWTTLKDSLQSENSTYNIVFMQYLYYMNFNLKIPGSYNEIYNWDNCYLFKNTSFLKEGDLIFFKQNHRPYNEIGFYLCNNYFISSSVSGKLNFFHLNDTTTFIQIISNAKLNKQ